MTPRSRGLLEFRELVIHWIDTSVASINIGDIITMVPVMVVNTFTSVINNDTITSS